MFHCVQKCQTIPPATKIVVLVALAGVDIELRYARPEIARFSPHAKIVEDPHIEPHTGLQHTSGGSRLARTTGNEGGAFIETSDSAPKADPWRNGRIGKNV